ncbi:hypothetical protein P5G50_17095 [Leifsonia sp. F6_8S_P_1B]|uniref:ABC transporter permease n=1 Tax=Leifsonia williamsii TaxID=3035919 RepID=A0ABT8KG82_9MICO|nr:hypothetical protein [Leifsonia williamsii]MDN4616167.1 hypothetical protein [Leifsonia williamsii]
MREGWSVGSMAREAWRNATGPRSRLALLIPLALVYGMALPWFATLETKALHSALAAQASAGRGVLVFQAADRDSPVAISRASCEALVDRPGVTRAGILREATSASFLQLGDEVPVQEASTSLFPQLRDGRALIGAALWKSGGTVSLITAEGRSVAAQAMHDQPAGIDTNSAVVVALDPSVASAAACIVVLDLFQRPNSRAVSLASALHVQGGPIGVHQTFSEASDVLADFRKRPGTLLPLGGALVAGCAAGLTGRSRRSELAVYRLVGSSRNAVGALVCLEQLIIAGIAATSVAFTTVTMRGSIVDATAQTMLGVAGAAVWSAVALALMIDLPLRDPLGMAKDR